MVSRPRFRNEGQEVVISFEALHGGKPGALPPGYAGFTWSASAWFLSKELYPSACMKSQAALFNANGNDLSFQREDPFHLKGLSLSALWRDATDVILEGWAKGVRKYSQIVTIHNNVATKLELDYEGIDRVSLKTGGAHIVVDSIVLRLD
jgi:hypothetical protein